MLLLWLELIKGFEINDFYGTESDVSKYRNGYGL